MATNLVARWRDWSGDGLEHLELREGADAIVAKSVVIATVEREAFAVQYRIECDLEWRVRKFEIQKIGERALRLASDGAGNWFDESGVSLPNLAGAIDIDISITPFTNTLPIRRLSFAAGQSHEIVAVYLQLPGLTVTTDRQRYTCIQPGKLFKYESIDSDFTRDVEVDDRGLVVNYPGLFRRLL